jgi:hypothetical protein
MAFKTGEVEQLLADTGRRCCVCGKLHGIQVHHIVPKEKGGSDDIDNAITLCPNCHDEVHQLYIGGMVTRTYTYEELKLHRKRTIKIAHQSKSPTPSVIRRDKSLIIFYAACLDRPAFRNYFMREGNFVDFDKALEDTLLAINTGFWKTRSGELIEKNKGKAYVANPAWKAKLDEITALIVDMRDEFRKAAGLETMFFHRFGMMSEAEVHEYIDNTFRENQVLAQIMDTKRRKAVEIINSILEEIKHPLLQAN